MVLLLYAIIFCLVEYIPPQFWHCHSYILQRYTRLHKPLHIFYGCTGHQLHGCSIPFGTSILTCMLQFLHLHTIVQILLHCHTLQVQSQSVLCEASCRCMCTEQGIEYVRLSPLLVTEVDPEETDNQKLLDMLWTTRTYLHHNTHLLDRLKQFFVHYTD